MIQHTDLIFVVSSAVLAFMAGLLGHRGRFEWGFSLIILSLLFTGALTASWLIEDEVVTAAKILSNITIATVLFSYIWWGFYKAPKAPLAFWFALAVHALILRVLYL